MTQPNIVLITTDQQRFDTAPPNAPPFLRTPHLRILANEGVTFDRAYADCPICVPARTSIMTGNFALTHGMLGNNETSGVMGYTETLPARLAEHGYQTCAIGKMHFGPQRVRHGFHEMIILQDYYDEMEGTGVRPQPMGTGLDQNELYPGLSTVPEGLTLTNWIAEQSLRYIRDRRDPTRPFLLWTSFSKPHPPIDPPEPYYSMYRSSPIADPIRPDWSRPGVAPAPIERLRQTWDADRLAPEVIRAAREAYLGMVTQIDYNIGKIVAGLAEAGLYDDTLILFCSDHGELLGDHWSSGKVLPYEGSARVPFILRPPRSWARQRRGETDDALVTHADILPTLLEAAGASPNRQLDGRSLLSRVGDAHSAPPRTTLEIACTSWEAIAPYQKRDTPAFFALTDGRLKYVWYPEGGSEQLFDLAADPQETTNRITDDQYRIDAERLRAGLMERVNDQSHRRIAPEGGWMDSHGLRALPLGTDDERTRRAGRTATFFSTKSPTAARH